MVLGLIWFLSHLWVVEVILASSFRERERERDFGTFFDGVPSKRMLPLNWERSRSRHFSKDRSHSPRWKRRVSFVVLFILSFSLLHILDLVVFLLCLIDFCFWKFSFFASFQWKSVVLVGLICLLFSFFSLQIHEEEEKVVRVSLSMKDCGAASRAAKSPLRLLFWKTWGIFSFQSANMFFVCVFLNFVLPRRLLVERQWVLGSEMSSPWNSCWCFLHKL